MSSGGAASDAARRLKDALDADAHAPPRRLNSPMLKGLRRRTGDDLTHDDVTLMAMEVL